MEPDPSEDPALFLAILRALIERHDQTERTKRRKDDGKLPSGIHEALEDIGRIEGALDSLARLWHKDDPKCRKGMLLISQLAFDLKKKIRQRLYSGKGK